MKLTVIPIVVGALGRVFKVLQKWELKKKKGDHTDHSIVKICLNIQESPGDLKGFHFTENPVKYLQ